MTSYHLNVFDGYQNKKIGLLTVSVGRSAVPTAQDPFLWQWLGKGGSRFGTWEWKYGASGYHIIFTNLFQSDQPWGLLFADWKALAESLHGTVAAVVFAEWNQVG